MEAPIDRGKESAVAGSLSRSIVNSQIRFFVVMPAGAGLSSIRHSGRRKPIRNPEIQKILDASLRWHDGKGNLDSSFRTSEPRASAIRNPGTQKILDASFRWHDGKTELNQSCWCND
jgi:hypothetical protein